MTSLLEIRKEILSLVIEKDRQGKLSWSFDAGEASAKTNFGSYEFHLDKKVAATGNSFKIWLFDKDDEKADFFEIAYRSAQEKEAPLSFLYSDLQNLYSSVRERSIIAKVNPAIEALKDL